MNLRAAKCWTFLTVLWLGLLWTPSLARTDDTTEANSQLSRSEHLVILHVNDTHGHLFSHKVQGKDVGGIARLCGLIKQIRKENPRRVLLVHAGDVLSRGDKITNHYAGQANIDLMNLLGYDAMVLGNGDYYMGMANLRKRMAQARFEILAGNIFEAQQKEPKAIGKDYVVKQVGPLRIGLVGLSLIRPEHPSSRNLRSGNNLELARKWVGELAGKTDLIVLLSHLGLPGDVMLGGMVGPVHVIVGGHSENALTEPLVIRKPKSIPDKTYIVQAGKYYEYLGRIDLDFERTKDDSWKVTKIQSKLIRIDASVKADSQIAAKLEAYRQGLEPKTMQAHQKPSSPAGAETTLQKESSSKVAQPVGAGVSP